MKAIIGILLAAFLFLAGCKNAAEKQQEQPADTLQVVEDAEEHHHDHDEAIVLNDGKKWTVDAPMLALIRNMESTILAYDQKKSVTPLTDSLQADIDRLTSNCTMKGQAHDELHKWLLPYIDLVNEAKSLPTADALHKLKESYATFNAYFE